MFHSGDGSVSTVNFGYGDYLVTIKSAQNALLDKLDDNVSVGMFTFERYGPFTSEAKTYGGKHNPRREIDLAEISTWGWNHQGTCPFKEIQGKFNTSILCKGNAQFALQDYTQTTNGVQRYDIGANTTVMTLVMHWQANKVKFSKFNGSYKLDSLPPHPTLTWTSPKELNQDPNFEVDTPPDLAAFTPNPTETPPNPPPPQSCTRFHLNFWTGNFLGGNQAPSCPNCNPGPQKRQEVIITNFEYKPLKSARKQ
jgi:hypothetical protein